MTPEMVWLPPTVVAGYPRALLRSSHKGCLDPASPSDPDNVHRGCTLFVP